MVSNHDRLRTESHSILVVDDDDEVREMLAETLQDFGYAVIQAHGAEEALAILSRHTEVIMMITDIRMPGMSGLELADRVQRERSDVRVIVISGYFHPQPVAQRFLMKPFRLHELASAVRSELGRA